MKKLKHLATTALTSAAIAAGSPAWAQDRALVSAESESGTTGGAEEKTEIVVTGSIIRGINPAGSALIGINSDDITAQGATSGLDALANLPQAVNFFQNLPAAGGNTGIFSTRLPIARPNLRSLPITAQATGPFTLILVDGHRMVPVGITGMGIDPEAVPSALLQRVDVMPDGASAVYGSDAVAGVINFITRDSFDGIRADARYGFADKYWAYDANITAGKKWDGGGIFASFSYSKHDALYGRDRDYIQSIDWNPQSPTYLQGVTLTCSAPNITVNGRTYPMTASGGTIQPYTTNGGTTGGNGSGTISGGNRCDASDNQSYYPKQTRYDVTAGLSQQLSDSLKVDIRGFWHRSETMNQVTPLGPPNPPGFVTVAANNPLRLAGNGNLAGVPGVNPADINATQTLRLNFEPIYGPNSGTSETTTDWWQITPSFAWDVAEGWQVRFLGSYGESISNSAAATLDSRTTTGVQARVTAGLINPYNLRASAAGAFDNLLKYNRRFGEFEFTNFRAIADGRLFSLPGGDVRVAIGAEYARTHFKQGTSDANYVYGTPLQYTQSVNSVFGELSLPIVGDNNAFGGVHSLFLSASGRYDHYSDFGGTTNPSLGLTYQPVDWISLRGTWGKSFIAPNVIDQLGSQNVLLNVTTATVTPLTNLATFPLVTPAQNTAANFGSNAIALVLNQGAVTLMGPQKSTNWSVGFDIEPPFVPGLTLSASYYSLKIDGLIGFPGGQSLVPSIASNFPQFVITNGNSPLSPALVAELVSLTTPASQAASGYNANYAAGVANGTIPVAYFIDNRARNLSKVAATGIDFALNYRNDTGWGSWDLSFAGNHAISTKSNTGGVGAVDVDFLAGSFARWRWSANAGVTYGKLRSQVTWQHTAGYPVAAANIGTIGTATTPGTLSYGQTHVDPFDTIDLFFRYQVDGSGLGKDLSFTLNITNVFDTNPPLVTGGGLFPGFALETSGFTLGRYIQLGVSKEF